MTDKIASRLLKLKDYRKKVIEVTGRPELPINPELPEQFRMHLMYVNRLVLNQIRVVDGMPWTTQDVRVIGTLPGGQHTERWFSSDRRGSMPLLADQPGWLIGLVGEWS